MENNILLVYLNKRNNVHSSKSGVLTRFKNKKMAQKKNEKMIAVTQPIFVLKQVFDWNKKKTRFLSLFIIFPLVPFFFKNIYFITQHATDFTTKEAFY